MGNDRQNTPDPGMAGSQSRPEWRVEVGGKTYGPYTRDQIKSFLKEGRVETESRANSPRLGERWITVRELLEQAPPQAAPPPAQETPRPAAKTAVFEPPSRPAESWTEADPTRDLFDALQAARERKSTPRPPLETESIGSRDTSLLRRVPPQALLVGGIGLILLVAVWGVTRAVNQQATETTTESAPVARTRTQPTPPRPIHTQGRTARPSLRAGLSTSPRAVPPPTPPRPPRSSRHEDANRDPEELDHDRITGTDSEETDADVVIEKPSKRKRDRNDRDTPSEIEPEEAHSGDPDEEPSEDAEQAPVDGETYLGN